MLIATRFQYVPRSLLQQTTNDFRSFCFSAFSNVNGAVFSGQRQHGPIQMIGEDPPL